MTSTAAIFIVSRSETNDDLCDCSQESGCVWYTGGGLEKK